MDVLVAEVGRQIRKPLLRIDAIAVPREHAIGHERMAKIMNARADTPTAGLQPRTSHDLHEQLLGHRVRIAPGMLLMPEEAR